MMDEDSPNGSTIPAEASGDNVWETRVRVGAVGFVLALVLLSLVGLLGVRTGVAHSSGNGYEIAVTHAEITRAGLATPFHVTITRSDGSPLPARVTTRIDASYLEMLDENGLEPDPVDSYNTRGSTWWTFAVPEGETELDVRFDVRLEPAIQWGRDGRAAVEVDGTEMTFVEYHTWVLP